MLLPLAILVTQINFNVDAQKFRMDYMWAQGFKTFYRLHDLATNWDQANKICEAEGTTLIIPNTLEEMDNLKLLMSNMKAHYTAIYVGIHDRFSNGDYVTLKGDSVAGTFLDLIWTQGSPHTPDDEDHCVVMTREGLLDDQPCTAIYPFVCKIPGEDVRYNEKCDNFDLGYIPQDNGKCYKFHDEPLSWNDAYLVCKSEAANLVMINSPKEATLITNMFSEYVNCIAPDPNILHVGFSDLMYPYQYRTVLGISLEEAGYSLMNPIVEDRSVMGTKRCGSFSRTGYLTMTSCDQPAMFLCEKLINKTEGE